MKSIVNLLILLSFLFSLSNCSEDKKIYVSVVFDVEDYITPASEGIDDIPKWLAEIMSEVGVTGTFFVIGEKARSLESRGRQDVITAMAKHDIGSHTNFGSIHPTVTEILEMADWDSGVQQMLDNESAGFEELERIFGVPVNTLARHGGSYGPQLIYALGQMGKGYVYSPIHLPGHNAVWFCNTLNFHGEYGYFDNVYYKDELFNPVFDSLQDNFQKHIEGRDVIAFFACHPCKVRTEQFWDFNFYYGANPDLSECKAPELRPLESMETAKKNFRRLIEFLKSQDNIEITTYSDLKNRFSFQRDFIDKKDLQRYAENVITEKTIVIDNDFSPAEMFAAFARSLDEYVQNGKLPARLERISPLGPMEMPYQTPEISEASMSQVYTLARSTDSTIRTDGSLPPWLYVSDKRIGTGSLLALFSEVYLDAVDGEIKELYPVIPFSPYPTENEEAIISGVEDCKHWVVHRPDLDMTHLVKLTRLQLWTLKPAQEK